MTVQEAKFEYLLRLGDSSLIIGHRLSEWCGHGPILEEDIALINIALDFVGNATSNLGYAGQVENKGRNEDDLAYLRGEREFRNLLITEQPNGDYANTIARQFLFDTYMFFLYEELKSSKDETIAAIAVKSHKEITYHLRHTSEWMLRLGDGTAESHERLQNGINDLWMFTSEMFDMDLEPHCLVVLDHFRQAWFADGGAQGPALLRQLDGGIVAVLGHATARRTCAPGRARCGGRA